MPKKHILKLMLLLVVLTGNSSFIAAQTAWQVFDTGNSGIPNNTVRTVLVDSSNHVWVGTDGGLAEFDGLTWNVFTTSNSGLPENQVRALNVDRNGELWVGTFNSGIAHFDGANWMVYNTGNSDLPSNSIRAIAFDQANHLWVGSGLGLSQLSDTGWASWNSLNSNLFTNNVADIKIDDNDTKYLGTLNGGLSIVPASDDTIYTWTTFNSNLADNTLNTVALDNSGLIWGSTPAAGVLAHDGMNTMLQWFAQDNGLLPTNACHNLLIAPDQTKYITTFDQGLLALSGTIVTTYNTFTSDIPENDILCIAQDTNAVIWLGGATTGLIRFELALGVEAWEKPSLDIYPTILRAGESLTIPAVVKNLNYDLLDTQGKVIRSGTTIGNQLLLPTSIEAGLYFIRLENQGIARFVVR